MNKRPYTKFGRLSDVLALIQVLALDTATKRTEQGIGEELQGPPTSAVDWFTLAREHRELFRVNAEEAAGISLVARYVLPHEEGQRRPPLSPEFVSALIQTAMNLHDRQAQSAEWWKSLLPLGAALVGSGTTLLTLWLNHKYFH
jgi:hypothetical protein